MNNNPFFVGILYLGNLLFILFIINHFSENTKFYSLVTVVLLFGYLVLQLFLFKNKWLQIVYHSVFLIIQSLCLLSLPMGIAFALIGGLKLTLLITLGYILLGGLLGGNVYQIYHVWKKEK